MTIAEINALTVQDVSDELLRRLDLEVDPEDGTLEAELIIMKDEMIAAETERLRREDWKNRFEVIIDPRATLNAMGIQPENIKKWMIAIVDSKDETLLIAMETQYAITRPIEIQKNSDNNQWHLDREAAIIELKALDWASVTTVAKMRAVLKKTLKILLK